MSHVRWLAAAAAAVLVLSCSGGGGGNSPTEPPRSTFQTIVVEVHDNSFSPKTVTIQPGDTVRWVMRGSAAGHTVTARDGSFDSGEIFTASGASFERRFDEARKTYEYSCKTHQGCCMMQGSIRVGNDAPDPIPGY